MAMKLQVPLKSSFVTIPLMKIDPASNMTTEITFIRVEFCTEMSREIMGTMFVSSKEIDLLNI